MNHFKAEKKNVKIIGRTYQDNDTVWMALSGTGIEFTADASICNLVIKGDRIATGNAEEEQARIAIYVNQQLVVDTLIKSAETTYPVWQSEKKEPIQVRLIKLSEAAHSSIGIKEIVTDAEKIQPTAEKPLKLEFIGDSITCGYGVDDEDGNHNFKTSTENITKSFSFLTAKELNADYSMVSYSGYGVSSGYTEGGKNTDSLVPTYYEKVAFTRGRFGNNVTLADITWNFKNYVPNLIILNLGTNDDTYCQNYVDRQKEFQYRYIEFLKVIRKNNPSAYILCIFGMMGQRLLPYVENAICDYKLETKDEQVSFFKMNEQKAENGYSANFHPSVKTHQLATNQLVAEIKKVIHL